jgi:hypothetical protein
MGVALSLDHVVVRVEDLAAGIENYSALGFTVASPLSRAVSIRAWEVITRSSPSRMAAIWS